MVGLIGSLGAGSPETVRDPGTCAGECERTVAFTLDPQFNADEQRVIIEAMHVWEQGQRRARPASRPRRAGPPGHREDSIDPISFSLLGSADFWPQHVALTKGGRIWVVASRIDDPGEYRALIVHELGHHLGIGHIEDTALTYMHSTINDTPVELWKHGRLPDRDGRAYCAVHRCTCAL